MRLEVEISAWGDNIGKLRRDTSLKTFFSIAFLWDCKESTYWKRPWCWERLRAVVQVGYQGWWLDSITNSMDMNLSKLKDNTKECSNYYTIAFISHTSKVMQKFYKPGFNSMWTMNFHMLKLDLEKAEEPEVKLPTSVGSLKKQEFQKII